MQLSEDVLQGIAMQPSAMLPDASERLVELLPQAHGKTGTQLSIKVCQSVKTCQESNHVKPEFYLVICKGLVLDGPARCFGHTRIQYRFVVRWRFTKR